MEAERRSGNYGKSSWDSNYIQRLTTPYGAIEYVEKAEKLKEYVKTMFEGTTDVLAQLQLIDDLQRLDVSHHLDDSVQKSLDRIYHAAADNLNLDLHATALKFRLLRQHGYHVYQEVFSGFMDDMGNFKASLGDDIKGLLSLYEASFLSMEGEPILDSAKDFSTRHLIAKKQADHGLSNQIRHALEIPLHWRVPKLQAKWFINVYETRPDANLTLLEFAKLYYNIAQASYQDDMKRISRGHRRSGLGEKLTFARDPLAESFLWAVGFTPEPEFGYTREIINYYNNISLMEAERRSGNYGKSSWDSNYIQRLTTPYGAIEYVEKAEKLKEYVKTMFEGTIGTYLRPEGDVSRSGDEPYIRIREEIGIRLPLAKGKVLNLGQFGQVAVLYR